MTGHEDFHNLNLWIWHEVFPGVDPTLSRNLIQYAPPANLGKLANVATRHILGMYHTTTYAPVKVQFLMAWNLEHPAVLSLLNACLPN